MALTFTAAGPIQVNFNGTVSVIDPSGIQSPLSKIIPTLVANMTASTFGETTLNTTPLVVSLPASPTQLLYAKNLSAANTITFTWTPVGSASAQIMVLQPGGVLFFFNPANGITALTVVSNGASTLIDYVLAG
jgi:hypothetical protein